MGGRDALPSFSQHILLPAHPSRLKAREPHGLPETTRLCSQPAAPLGLRAPRSRFPPSNFPPQFCSQPSFSWRNGCRKDDGPPLAKHLPAALNMRPWIALRAIHGRMLGTAGPTASHRIPPHPWRRRDSSAAPCGPPRCSRVCVCVGGGIPLACGLQPQRRYKWPPGAVFGCGSAAVSLRPAPASRPPGSAAAGRVA